MVANYVQTKPTEFSHVSTFISSGFCYTYCSSVFCCSNVVLIMERFFSYGSQTPHEDSCGTSCHQHLHLCEHPNDNNGRHKIAQNSLLGIGAGTHTTRAQHHVYQRFSSRLPNAGIGGNHACQFRLLR